MSAPAPPGPAGRPAWPPPGARVREIRIEERSADAGEVRHRVLDGETPQALHLRALVWLLVEHERDPPEEAGAPWCVHVRLEIASTPMEGGRLGHAYRLDGGPLGSPRAGRARGVLWRFVHAALSRGVGPPLSDPPSAR